MKKLTGCLNICAIIIGGAITAFCAEPVIDFDGISGGIKDISSYISDNESLGAKQNPSPKDFVSMPTKAEQHVLVKSISGEWQIVQPEKITDGLEGKTFYYAPFLPGTELRLDWYCGPVNNSAAKKGWRAVSTFAYDLGVQRNEAKHMHSDVANPPLFTEDPLLYPPDPYTFPEQPLGTTYSHSFTTPIFATAFFMYTTFVNCKEDNPTYTDFFTISVSNLVPMRPGAADDSGNDKSGYRLIPSDTVKHPSVHNIAAESYNSSLLKNELLSLGRQWRTSFPGVPPLHYLRMSLPWGGVFDETFNLKEPYKGHAWGEAVDIGKPIPVFQNSLLGKMCEKFRVWSEPDGDGRSHFHIVRRTFSPPPTIPMNVNPSEDSTPCCIKDATVDEACWRD